jgi:hypothetical protein
VTTAVELLGPSVMDCGKARTRVTVTAFAGRRDRGPARTTLRHVHRPRWSLFPVSEVVSAVYKYVIFIYSILIFLCSVHRIHIPAQDGSHDGTSVR